MLVYVVWSLPFALWMLQGYVRAVPRELEEAAAVDGAGRLAIARPRRSRRCSRRAWSRPLLFAFISAWNEFFFALVLLQDPGR